MTILLKVICLTLFINTFKRVDETNPTITPSAVTGQLATPTPTTRYGLKSIYKKCKIHGM